MLKPGKNTKYFLLTMYTTKDTIEFFTEGQQVCEMQMGLKSE